MNDSINKKYNDVLSLDGPQTPTDIVSDKMNAIHEKLYENALNAYIESIGEDVDEYKANHLIIEQRENGYYKPSHIVVIGVEKTASGRPRRTKKNIDLGPYWNRYRENMENSLLQNTIYNEEMIVNAELIYIDYAAGKAKMCNRIENKEFWVSFDYINKDTIISDEYSLKNTFGGIIQRQNDR